MASEVENERNVNNSPQDPKKNCATEKEGRNRFKLGRFFYSQHFEPKNIYERHIVSSSQSAICKLSKE